MRSRLPALVAVAVLVALSLPAIAGARSAPSAAEAAHARILAYWTPERVASAQPREFVRTEVGFAQAPIPRARPGGGGGGTGASWTGNGTIELRSGRVLFAMGGSNWICSGSVVNGGASGTSATVLTAGHCVYDGADGWATNWLFIPDFDDAPTYTCANTVYGCWTATRLGANADFVTGGGFGNDTVHVDYGFALVGPGGKAGNVDLDSIGGTYNLKTTATSLSDTQWAFGYPAAKKYKGNDLVYCTGSLIDDPYGADTWGMACNMTGGSSGGPWLHGTTNPASTTTPGQASSVNSYGYSNLSYMFGPKFNAETSTVVGDTADGTATNGVSAIHNLP
jgi:V8-like Glu-specific endopeptidase